MKSIFISSPFFSVNQNRKVAAVEKALANNPTISYVYSPRQDQLSTGYDPKKQTYEWANEIYRRDLTELKYADVELEILDFDDDDSDSGTSYEFGFAKALGKPTFTISLDKRPVNLMLAIGSDFEFRSLAELQHHDFNRPISYKYRDGIYGLMANGYQTGNTDKSKHK